MAMRSRDDGKAQPVSVFSGRHDRRKVTDWVYEELKSAIVDLRLAPGDPLREAALAEQLGVSKTPSARPSPGFSRRAWWRPPRSRVPWSPGTHGRT